MVLTKARFALLGICFFTTPTFGGVSREVTSTVVPQNMGTGGVMSIKLLREIIEQGPNPIEDNIIAKKDVEDLLMLLPEKINQQSVHVETKFTEEFTESLSGEDSMSQIMAGNENGEHNNHPWAKLVADFVKGATMFSQHTLIHAAHHQHTAVEHIKNAIEANETGGFDFGAYFGLPIASLLLGLILAVACRNNHHANHFAEAFISFGICASVITGTTFIEAPTEWNETFCEFFVGPVVLLLLSMVVAAVIGLIASCKAKTRSGDSENKFKRLVIKVFIIGIVVPTGHGVLEFAFSFTDAPDYTVPLIAFGISAIVIFSKDAIHKYCCRKKESMS